MVENSKISRIIFFRLWGSTGYAISENIDGISAGRKLRSNSLPCSIRSNALEHMGGRNGMLNPVFADIKMVTGGNRIW